MREKIVITGLGCITPIGHNIESFWEACLKGEKGFGPITHFDGTKVKTSLVAEVKDFDPTKLLGRKLSRRLDRFSQFAVHAAREAHDHADLTDVESTRIGICIGTGVGGVSSFEEEASKMETQGSSYVNPLCMPKWIPNMAAGNIAMDLKIHGPVHTVSTACASGIDAIGHAILLLESGRVDAVLAGGAEACITPTMIAGFENMGALSAQSDKNLASIPFDERRNGFVLGEGAAVLVIETLSSAQRRGANILAEIAGYGSSSDAYHLTAPHPEAEGDIRAINMAMKDADIEPKDVDYINAHGTATPQNDKTESKCFKAVFGQELNQVHINSTKSMVGHMQGAAGALETVVCVQTLLEGKIHPTSGSTQIDPDFGLTIVGQDFIEKKCKYVLNNALGFGGHNAVLILKSGLVADSH